MISDATKEKQTRICVDLFCGGGGLTAGLLEAADDLNIDLDVFAINHWGVAIQTHTYNHPRVKHLCESLEGVDPREIVPGGVVDLLAAAPECIHHSRARGGKPMSPQSRASIYHVLRWCDSLHVKSILIENVREIMDWGPLHKCTCDLGPGHAEKHPKPCQHGRPIQSKKGLYFRRFVGDLRARGYKVEYRLLNAAHYGDATTRIRFFLQATLVDDRAVVWPTQTHVAPNELSLFSQARPWRTARQIIDWSLPGNSIYNRKKPLARNTIKRIFAGLAKFCGLPSVEIPEDGRIPLFLIHPEDLRYLLRAKPADAPAEDQCPQREDFLTEYHGSKNGEQRVKPLDNPVPTVDTSNRFGLVQPVVVPVTHQGGEERSHSVEAPLPTVTSAHRGELAVAQPFLVPNFGEREGQAPRTHDIEAPLPAVTGHGAGELVQPRFVQAEHGSPSHPFVIPIDHSSTPSGPRSADNPISTITTEARHALVHAAFILPPEGIHRGNAPRPEEQPIQTITSRGGGHLVEPFILPHQHGSSSPENVRSVEEPLPTVTDQSSDMFTVEPYVVGTAYAGANGSYIHPTEEPLRTITTRGEHGIAQPCLIGAGGTTGQQAPQDIDAPIGTVLPEDRRALVEPHILNLRGGNDGYTRSSDIEEPLPTVTAISPTGLVEPYVIALEHSTDASGHDRRVKPIDSPPPTLTTRNGWGMVAPYLVKFYGGHHSDDVDKPIGALTASFEHFGVAAPYLVVFRNNMDGASPDKPLGTVCTNAAHFGVAEPHIINYNGTGTAHSTEEPLDTVTTHDRFGLIEPAASAASIETNPVNPPNPVQKADDLLALDILFRMLQPHELAAAHSFRSDYHFCGNRDDQVRQIGNSVPVQLARALCRCALGGEIAPALAIVSEAVA